MIPLALLLFLAAWLVLFVLTVAVLRFLWWAPLNRNDEGDG